MSFQGLPQNPGRLFAGRIFLVRALLGNEGNGRLVENPVDEGDRLWIGKLVREFKRFVDRHPEGDFRIEQDFAKSHPQYVPVDPGQAFKGPSPGKLPDPGVQSLIMGEDPGIKTVGIFPGHLVSPLPPEKLPDMGIVHGMGLVFVGKEPLHHLPPGISKSKPAIMGQGRPGSPGSGHDREVPSRPAATSIDRESLAMVTRVDAPSIPLWPAFPPTRSRA